MFAEKQNGAISRRVSALNSPIVVGATRSSAIFAGEIRLFAGLSSPPFNWLLCNGSVLARADYPKLFDVIGTLYGKGDEGEIHFRLPDLRGRVAVGVDREGVRAGDVAKQLGNVGGQATHILSVAQLPSHEHDRGQLATVHGGEHTHGIHDPGHKHYIPYNLVSEVPVFTGSMSSAEHPNKRITSAHRFADAATTGISVHSAGGHTHEVTGKTGTTGEGDQFSLLQPFQTFNYIIYAGD
jgi:microcystin-dependent protein